MLPESVNAQFSDSGVNFWSLSCRFPSAGEEEMALASLLPRVALLSCLPVLCSL